MNFSSTTRFAAGMLLAAASQLASGHAEAAPDTEPWLRWDQHVVGSDLTVDHSAWDAVLAETVVLGDDGVARVNYQALTQDPLRARLDAYVAHLSGVPVSELDRPEQQAFWINLYNALTLLVVRDHYPVETIRDIDISPGIFSNGPWGAKLLEVEGEVIALDDIEHRILRPLWGDPRIHYALNCASIGCPNLKRAAWRADTLDTDLDAAAAAYVNHDRGVSAEGRRLIVSSIYDWFIIDFGGDETGVLHHLEQYAEPERHVILQASDGIADHRYDWALNDLTGETQ